ncbi:MAG: hypothetical protein WDM86_12105 [Rhizomicrobium sp.]
MALNRQLDLFLKDIQPDLLENEPVQTYRPKVDDVRQELFTVLATARAAKRMPWTPAKAKYHQTVFPQMCNWLPEAEAAQLRLEFETEMARLAAE